MVVLEFLDGMVADLSRLFAGMVFEDSSGGKSGMHIFKQDFPIRKFSIQGKDKKDEDDLYPYCVIRAENGTNGTSESLQTIDITLTFGICERSEENNGELRVLNLIERVSQHFLNERVIGGKFRLDYNVPIRWGLPTEKENTYPYFYGLMEMTWDSFFETGEDRYA